MESCRRRGDVLVRRLRCNEPPPQCGARRAPHPRARAEEVSPHDERIRDDINDRLTDNDWLDATNVEAVVAGGEVTLSGTVDSRYAKRIAEDISASVTGVSNVQNNLRVQSYRAEPGASAPAGTSAGEIGASSTTGTSDATETGKASRAAGRS